MAVLDLLSDVATGAALLLVVEDPHWVDRPTADALAFVALRIASYQRYLEALDAGGRSSV
jgi:hypothetical protein